MASIRILVNGIELDHVREDLDIREENNSFGEKLKVSHTTRPVRIIENKKAVEALGEFSITASSKKKFFPCKIYIGGIHYSGILTQNERIRGFRKCDIKFGSELNEVMDKAISTFFPTYSVVPESPDYSEESPTAHNANTAWEQEAANRKGKVYPEVKWGLPQMRWRGKFGDDLKQEDTHYKYAGWINWYMLANLVTNTPATDWDGIPNNTNVISPQVFLLSPLHYAFASIGYVLRGKFVEDPFFKRLMLLSFKDNMTKIIQRYPGDVLDIVAPAWEEVLVWNILGIQTPSYGKRVLFIADTQGTFKIRYKVRLTYDGNLISPMYGMMVLINGELVDHWRSSKTGHMNEGEIPIDISEDQIGQEIEVVYYSQNRTMPAEHLIEFAEDLPDLEFYDQHPTIDFTRYLPDWTVATFLENIKNTWNLKIDIDDVSKEVHINFNEDYLLNGEIIEIGQSLQVAEITNIQSESYLLKFENDSDPGQFISHEGSFAYGYSTDENTIIHPIPFKYIPHTSTADLSDAVEDKEGIGLVLAAVGSLETTDTFDGRTLSITGDGGIFDSYWRRWFLFRLNASSAVLKGPFSQTELFKVSKAKKIYIDHQLWLIKSIRYKENSSALLDTQLEVESVTF